MPGPGNDEQFPGFRGLRVGVLGVVPRVGVLAGDEEQGTGCGEFELGQRHEAGDRAEAGEGQRVRARVETPRGRAAGGELVGRGLLGGFQRHGVPASVAHLVGYAGTPGPDPEDGDLICSTPWGNLGFHDDADGIDHADDTLHLGTYRASAEQLELLEGSAVDVRVVA